MMARLWSIVFEDTLPTIEWRKQWTLVGIVSGAVLLRIVWKTVAALRKQAETVHRFPGPKPHWLFGNLDKLRNDEGGMHLLNSWARLYGKAYVMWFGATTPLLLVQHPDTSRAILSSDEPKAEQLYKCFRPWIGDGLIVSKGEKWARNRRLLTKAFHFQVLHPQIEVFSESTNVLVSKWRQMNGGDATVELHEDICLLMLDSLTKCIFGINTDCQSTEVRHPYPTAVLDMLNLLTERMRFFPYHNDLIYYFTIGGYRFRRACRVAHDFSRNVVREREQERQNKDKDSQPKNKYVNFIDILLDAKDEDGKGLSRDEIFDEVDTFMFAGHDTTASGLSWFLYNLAKHPEYQEKCRQEVNEILGSRNTLTWEDVSKLEYTTQCLKESLRLNTPVLNIGRQTTHDITFSDGRTAPEGASLLIDINGTHYNPELWPNPEVYDPERFAPDNVQGRSPFSYIPFSAGYRNCIGQQFAQNEMKTAAALILKNFDLTHDVTRPAVRQPTIVLRSASGLWVHVKPLQPQFGDIA